MQHKGRTIKMFLMDGQPNGRLQCELSNWTGKVCRIPTKLVKESESWSDLDRTGVYILLGRDNDDRGIAYIGETDNLRSRLKQHMSKKDFWNEAIFIISKDDNLNRAHVKYLEKRLYDIARETGRYTLDNSLKPGGANICESDQAEMEEFIEKLKILVNALGSKIFESIRTHATSKAEEAENTFYIEAVRGAYGMGQRTSEGFVVLKGSVITDSVTKSYAASFLNLRNRLVDEGTIENLIFTKDCLFSSPSTAAAIVMGRNANGLTEWRLKDGRILKALE